MSNIPPSPQVQRLNLLLKSQPQAQSMPVTMQKTSKQRIVEGLIVGPNKNGSTRIDTKEGPLDVRISGNKPESGTRVSILLTPDKNRNDAPPQVKLEIKGSQNTQTAAAPKYSAPATTQNINSPAPFAQSTGYSPPSTPYGGTASASSQPFSRPLEIGQAINLQSFSASSSFTALPATPSLNTQANSLLNNGLASFPSLAPANNTSSLFSALINASPTISSGALLQNVLNIASPLAPTSTTTLAGQTPQQTTSLSAPLPPHTGITSPQTSGAQITTGTAATSVNAGSSTGLTGNPPATTTVTTTASAQNATGTGTPNTNTIITATTTPNSIQTSYQKPPPPPLLINARITNIEAPQTLQGANTLSGTATTNGTNTPTPTSFTPVNTRPGQLIGVVGAPLTSTTSNAATTGSTTETTSTTRHPVTLHYGGRALNGQFLLPQNATGITEGSVLTLKVQNTQQLLPSGQALNMQGTGIGSLFMAWGGDNLFAQDLVELLDIFTAKAPAEITANVIRAMPQMAAPQRLVPGMMFFMAALKGGDITQWLGDKASTLLNQQNQSGALERAGNSFSTMSNLFNDPAPVPNGEWRSLQLPLFFGTDLSHLQFHIKDYTQHNQDDKDDAQDTPLKRILIDFTMSRMGEMQIDSLLMNNRLETVLRSPTAFSPDMRQDLRQRYTSIMEAIGYQGQIDFQDRKAHG